MDYRLLANEVLLKFLKISDELAFEEIYLRNWRELYYFAINKINSKEVAEDMTTMLRPLQVWTEMDAQGIFWDKP